MNTPQYRYNQIIENQLLGSKMPVYNMVQDAYLVSLGEAKVIDGFVGLHVKRKPTYMPRFVYNWFLKKFLVLVNFKKRDGNDKNN